MLTSTDPGLVTLLQSDAGKPPYNVEGRSLLKSESMIAPTIGWWARVENTVLWGGGGSRESTGTLFLFFLEGLF